MISPKHVLGTLARWVDPDGVPLAHVILSDEIVPPWERHDS